MCESSNNRQHDVDVQRMCIEIVELPCAEAVGGGVLEAVARGRGGKGRRALPTALNFGLDSVVVEIFVL